MYPLDAETWRLVVDKLNHDPFICFANAAGWEPLTRSVRGSGGILDKRETTIFALAEGECFDDPDADWSGTLALVDCDDPHDNETYAVLAHPAGATEPYPGKDAIEAFADVCAAEFEARVESDVRDDLAWLKFWPDGYTWALGNRAVTCILFDANMVELTEPMSG